MPASGGSEMGWRRAGPGLAALLLLGILAGISGCRAGTPEELMDDSLPDTFPLTGVGSDLPEGMPLPPPGDDGTGTAAPVDTLGEWTPEP
jgi:hypothetical protein